MQYSLEFLNVCMSSVVYHAVPKTYPNSSSRHLHDGLFEREGLLFISCLSDSTPALQDLESIGFRVLGFRV